MSLLPKRQTAGLVAAVIAVAETVGGLPILAQLFSWFRKMIGFVGDTQTTLGLGIVGLRIAGLIVAVLTLMWGFGGFDAIKRHMAHQPFRMSIKEFLADAASAGWAHGDLYELQKAVRQAGVDGLITFYGRKAKTTLHTASVYPLSEIPREHFLENWILTSIIDDNTTDGATRTSGPSDPVQYADIHADRRQARRWLKTEGRWRG